MSFLFLKKRMLSFLIDMIISAIVTLPFLLILIFQEKANIYFMIFTFSWMFSILLCKDFPFGQSLGKRKFKLLVTDNKTLNNVGELRLILRNLFIAIWPIELLFLLRDPRRRFGDIVCNTKVNTCKSPISRNNIWKYLLIWLLVLISIFGCICIIFLNIPSMKYLLNLLY